MATNNSKYNRYLLFSTYLLPFLELASVKFLETRQSNSIKFCQNIILWSRRLYHEACKLSKNFTEGNTRKVSACFLRLHVCDVIQFQDDHAHMRIKSPLASLARLRRKRIVLISYYVLSSSYFREHCDTFWGDENLEFLPYVAAISFFSLCHFLFRILMYFATFRMLFFTRFLFAFRTVYICYPFMFT